MAAAGRQPVAPPAGELALIDLQGAAERDA
jgi:hypothetical protein